MKTTPGFVLILAVAFSLPVYAQDAAPPNESPSAGWRRAGETPPPPPEQPPQPSQLILPAGTWITVRVDQPLSSDYDQKGDAFTATLAQPLVVNGLVVARRGQTVGGVVAEVQKAGRVKGTSRLGIELTEISLADGRQVPVKTRLMESQGGTSMGRDAAAIGTTTGVGAAIGAAADGGFGAGMGAIAGAAASTIGVLITRGRPTVVYPETPLTFRLEAPVTVAADSYAAAFQPVSQQDYEQKPALRQRAQWGPFPPPYYNYYGYGWGYPGYPGYWNYYYPPYFYGPSFFFYSGPHYFHGGGFRGGRFHR